MRDIKQVMRGVQLAVKDVSKTISHSHLYHQAIGTKVADSIGPHGLAPPFPAGLTSAYAAPVGAAGTHSGYVTPVPATPLSAALGPAVQATVANTPNGTHLPRDYFQEPQYYGSRSTHERNDTVMQPPRQPRRQQ